MARRIGLIVLVRARERQGDLDERQPDGGAYAFRTSGRTPWIDTRPCSSLAVVSSAVTLMLASRAICSAKALYLRELHEPRRVASGERRGDGVKAVS